MALVKIFTKKENYNDVMSHVANAVKLIAAASLDVPEVPTTPDSIETVYVEGIDLAGIDYIMEVVAVERPDQQAIADRFISGLNQVYPDKSFSVYFNIISENGMANTSRRSHESEPISMSNAIELARKGGK